MSDRIDFTLGLW